MGNEWIEFVKAYAKDHNLKYNEALKEAGKSYKEMKGKFNKTNKKINGNGLKANTFKELLEASYSGKEEVEGFIMDKSISSKTSKVFVHPSGQVVVAHQGTASVMDWGNNAVYALTGDTGYKFTPRYKEARKVQEAAEKKYGAKNITTIGHSQGAYQAQLLGANSREIITLNKATRPQEVLYGSSKKKNQYDVRATGDLVSLFRNPFQTKNDKNLNVIGNPLTSHSTGVLDKNKDVIYGDKNFYVN
jgi:hypothetical protein